MKRWLTLTILMAIGLGALLFTDREYRAQIHQDNARALAQAGVGIKNRLKLAFAVRLSVVEDLRAFMLATASLPDNETFNRYAASSLEYHPAMRGLAYIDSNRVIRYFYPLKGNELAIGMDLMTRPAAPFVEKAIRERHITVSDPVVNIFGLLAVTARAPLYRGDQLLGLVQGVFDVSAILQEALTEADPRIALQLRDANGNRFGGLETFSGETQTLPVQVGDNAWTLSVGWQSLPPGPARITLGLIWGAGGALLLSLLFIVNRIWTQAEWLRTTVSNRTEALRQSRERLDVLLRAKSEFMNNVTHELRTPLNSVIGFSEMLKDEVPGPLNAKQAAFAADILASGERLLALVEGILEMSRLDGADAALEREPVEIGATLEARVAAHRKAAEARCVTIRLDVAPDAGRAELDPEALCRMLDALLDNAIKFNREGGEVSVRARRDDGWLEIAVADTGIGIAHEDLEKLFKPLVQLDAGLARRHGGVGLGLALARRLAELHGGTIEVESEPGKGSTFTLRFPIEEKS